MLPANEKLMECIPLQGGREGGNTCFRCRQKPATRANEQGAVLILGGHDAMWPVTLTPQDSMVLRQGPDRHQLKCQVCCLVAAWLQTRNWKSLSLSLCNRKQGWYLLHNVRKIKQEHTHVGQDLRSKDSLTLHYFPIIWYILLKLIFIPKSLFIPFKLPTNSHTVLLSLNNNSRSLTTGNLSYPILLHQIL